MTLKLCSYCAFFFLFLSCKKEITTSFPRGNWLLKEFVVNEIKVPNYSCHFDQTEYDYLLNNLIVSYDGQNQLNFLSDKSDELKIIKSENINETINFCGNLGKNAIINEEVKTSNIIILTLRLKELKKVKFVFTQLNDSILIGEFWIKNQTIARYDAPNITTGEWKIENINTKGPISTQFKSKIMGVFTLQK